MLFEEKWLWVGTVQITVFLSILMLVYLLGLHLKELCKCCIDSVGNIGNFHFYLFFIRWHETHKCLFCGDVCALYMIKKMCDEREKVWDHRINIMCSSSGFRETSHATPRGSFIVTHKGGNEKIMPALHGDVCVLVYKLVHFSVVYALPSSASRQLMQTLGHIFCYWLSLSSLSPLSS